MGDEVSFTKLISHYVFESAAISGFKKSKGGEEENLQLLTLSFNACC